MSPRPPYAVRLAPETLAILKARAAAEKMTQAAMTEIVITAGLRALGEAPPPVDLGSKEARKAVIEFKNRLGFAVEAALKELKG